MSQDLHSRHYPCYITYANQALSKSLNSDPTL